MTAAKTRSWEDVPECAEPAFVDVPLAEVNAPRVRYFLGGGRSGRRPSLPSDAALDWFLREHGYGLDHRGHVTKIYGGRTIPVDRAQLRKDWAAWERWHAWRKMPGDADRPGMPWMPVPPRTLGEWFGRR